MNVTVPIVVPKLVPVIVTGVFTAPKVTDRLAMLGVASTVNQLPLLAKPPTVTTTLPVVAPVGTTATNEIALQFEIEVAAVPLNATVLVPCVAPKFVPVIVTEVPGASEEGVITFIPGVTVNVNAPTPD